MVCMYPALHHDNHLSLTTPRTLNIYCLSLTNLPRGMTGPPVAEAEELDPDEVELGNGTKLSVCVVSALPVVSKSAVTFC